MQLRLVTTVATVVTTLLFLSTTSTAHNITLILSKFPEFSIFNQYLTTTHLAPEINTRQTITVCAVDNTAMQTLLSKNLPITALKNILSLHILLDYFSAIKLHQIRNGSALSTTMYQASGSAPGASGLVNITLLKGGKVGFGAIDNGGVIDATFVKSLNEIPYNISVIQITKILPSPEAEATPPEPSVHNLTEIMSGHGCKIFEETLLASPAGKIFDSIIDSGLTVFCPWDDAMKGFLPRFKNLTVEGKQSLLEYHGVPVFYSKAMLKSNNGQIVTLATNGANTFGLVVQNDGQDVILKTKIVTAKITDTLIEEETLAVFVIDKVLQPRELFKGVEGPSSAPAPGTDADAPEGSKENTTSPGDSPAESPADAPNGDDEAADDSGVMGFTAGGMGIFTAGVGFVISCLLV